MNTVNKTAKTIKDGISNMMAGAKEDYFRWSSGGDGQSSYSKEQLAKWDDSISIREGKKYIKVVRDNGVFCFISKTDLCRIWLHDSILLLFDYTINQQRRFTFLNDF